MTPCMARQKAHASQGIICQPDLGSGEPLSYLGGCLPALFAISAVTWQIVCSDVTVRVELVNSNPYVAQSTLCLRL